LKTRAYKDEYYKSPISTKEFIELENKYKVEIVNPPSPRYNAAGPSSLVDQRFGSENYHDGRWMGWQGQDAEILIDLQELKKLSTVGVNVMQNQGAWIFLPSSIEVLGSSDGTSYTSIFSSNPELKENTNGTQLNKYAGQTDTEVRFLKIIVKPYETLPDWHAGAGGKPFIFIDEIIIE
jgi:hypothetical protein